jgi:hypothetical protein
MWVRLGVEFAIQFYLSELYRLLFGTCEPKLPVTKLEKRMLTNSLEYVIMKREEYDQTTPQRAACSKPSRPCYE